MGKFKYIAIDKVGKEMKGTQEAASIQEVLATLRSRKLFPVKVLPVDSRFFSFSNPFTVKIRVKQKTVTAAARQLATLLGAGLPLVRSLKIMEEQQIKGSWKQVLSGLIESVESGSSFSEALGRYSNVFSKLFINTVKAGEAGGVMDIVLARLADYLEKSQMLRKKVISAMVYPCLVLSMAIVILLSLMIFVVPKFTDMFKDLNVDLPFVTSMLIKISDSMLTFRFWIIAIGMGVIIKFSFRFLKTIQSGRLFVDSLKLKFPVFGSLIQKILISRFSRTLGTLIGSGVPILLAINNSKESIENEVMVKGLTIVHDSVKEGESLVEPLKLCPIFDTVFINMIAVGEETGKLDEMLLRIADTYDGEVDTVISGIVSILEPFLIIILAGIVGFIVIALFLPLVGLLSALSQ